MKGPIHIAPPDGPLRGTFRGPRSKSIANRLMMLKAFAGEAIEVPLTHDPADIRTLYQALTSDAETVDVGMAGTAFRFMLPYLAMQAGRSSVLTGAPRMLQRPVGPLVDALRSLGADITYLGEEGYPPLQVRGVVLPGGSAEVDGSISSQFASALLLAAPFMQSGLSLTLAGNLVSEPYIEMTVALLRQCGAEVSRTGAVITVQPSAVMVPHGADEQDYSSASYAFLLAALRPGSRIVVPGLRPDSLQGDAVVCQLFKALGVSTRFDADGAVIEQIGAIAPDLRFDLTDCPDLAPALLAACAGLGAEATFTGVLHLAHKESDRMMAMATEFGKMGVSLTESNGTWRISGRVRPTDEQLCTYNDHRLAMSLAPLCLSTGSVIRLDAADVVTKSFPMFWEEMIGMGFDLKD